MRFGTPWSCVHFEAAHKKRSFTTKIIYSDFFETIRSMQQEQLMVHYPDPDHGSISSDETKDPFMEFPRRFCSRLE